MSIGLLDVNMLIALAWPSHVHHSAAHAWFERHTTTGWATCPFTQCGFVRISSNPAFTADAVTPAEAAELLRQMTATGHHHFWADDIPLVSADVPMKQVMGHRQVSDAYLLGLAMRHHGRLVTLDGGISNLVPREHTRALHIVPSK